MQSCALCPNKLIVPESRCAQGLTRQGILANALDALTYSSRAANAHAAAQTRALSYDHMRCLLAGRGRIWASLRPGHDVWQMFKFQDGRGKAVAEQLQRGQTLTDRLRDLDEGTARNLELLKVAPDNAAVSGASDQTLSGAPNAPPLNWCLSSRVSNWGEFGLRGLI